MGWVSWFLVEPVLYWHECGTNCRCMAVAFGGRSLQLGSRLLFMWQEVFERPTADLRPASNIYQSNNNQTRSHLLLPTLDENKSLNHLSKRIIRNVQRVLFTWYSLWVKQEIAGLSSTDDRSCTVHFRKLSSRNSRNFFSSSLTQILPCHIHPNFDRF